MLLLLTVQQLNRQLHRNTPGSKTEREGRCVHKLCIIFINKEKHTIYSKCSKATRQWASASSGEIFPTRVPLLSSNSRSDHQKPQLDLYFRVLGRGLAGNSNPWPCSERTQHGGDEEEDEGWLNKIGLEGAVTSSSPGRPAPATLLDGGGDGGIAVPFTCTPLSLP